jgi:hypothetical protein
MSVAIEEQDESIDLQPVDSLWIANMSCSFQWGLMFRIIEFRVVPERMHLWRQVLRIAKYARLIARWKISCLPISNVSTEEELVMIATQGSAHSIG